jgi:hypothetical protein
VPDRRPPGLVRVLTSRPARAVLVFTLLMLPIPAVGRTYGHLVGGLASLAVGMGASSEVEVRFTPGGAAGPAGDPWTLGIHVEDPGTGRYVGTALDLRRSGYIACVVFVALALATPLAGRRRLALLGGGLVPLQLLPLLPLLSFFSGKLPVRVFDFGTTSRALIEIGYHALVAPPGMAYAVPGLLWLLLVTLLDANSLPWPLTAARLDRPTPRLG